LGAKHKIPVETGRYYRRYWLELYDGGSDQWLYVCRDGRFEEGKGFTFFFIDITDMPAACGRDATYRWCASVDVVELLNASQSTIQSAMRSCGYEHKLHMMMESDRLALAEMLWQHGAKAPAWSDEGGKITFDDYGNVKEFYNENCPEFRRLRKEAVEFCEETLFDESNRNDFLMNRIVNKLGQSAREYANGTDGLWDSLRKIKEMGDEANPDQKLMLKIYANAETTLGAGPIPDDLRNTQQKGND